MTIKTSGALSMTEINAEFGLGNNLHAYRGVKWFKDDNSRGYFEGASGNNPPIDFYEFYGKRKTIPVTPTGNVNYSNGQWFTFPFYNKITVTMQGGSGGQAGQYGINGCTGNSPTGSGGGGTGGTSSFGVYGSAAGGGGGGGNQGGGSPGATTTLVFNAETDPNAPKAGIPVLITVGNGGGGGGGGPNAILIQTGTDFWGNPEYGCFPSGNAASGASGSPGYVTIRVE